MVILRERFRGDEDDSVVIFTPLRHFHEQSRGGGEVIGEQGPPSLAGFAQDAGARLVEQAPAAPEVQASRLLRPELLL